MSPRPGPALNPSPPAPADLPAGIVPCGLRCEGRRAPAAIETGQPRLTWELTAPRGRRGLRPTAYHLLVASAPDHLLPGRANCWDTGPVESSAVATEYQGSPLRSLERCYWTVRVRSEQGRWSAWSSAGTWTMGLLDPEREWTAPWIHAPDGDGRRASWFRRQIQLDATPDRAVALIASTGFHELYVNGRKVGEEVLVPNVCDGSQRAFYVAYDITPYLRPGANALGLWLGAGWSLFPPFQRTGPSGGPRVSGQFQFETAGVIQPVWTGTDWLVRQSPCTLLGSWTFRDFGGEAYDAARDLPGWAEPDQPTEGWVPAASIGSTLLLSADPAEPNRRQAVMHPIAVSEPSPGVYRLDFGRNFAGFVSVPLVAPPGTRVRLEFSEREPEAVTHQLHSEYVMGPTGHGRFENRFNYAAGRWMTLSGLREPPDPARIRAWCVRNDYEIAAAFTSSCARLNAIVEVARWTFENLTTGGFVADCPHRERMGYGGDGHASVTTGLYHFRLDAFLAKWNRDWHDVQGHPPRWASSEDPSAVEPPPSGHPGELPYTAPTYWGGGGPAWSGLCVHLPWQLYRFTGDRRVLERSLPVIGRWLDFLETKVSDGLLQRWGGKWDFLGDWLTPREPDAGRADGVAALLFNNCYRIWSLQTAAEIARTLGQVAPATQWAAAAAAARTAVHARFFNPRTASYGDGTQVSLAAALLAGVPGPDERPRVVARLEQEIRQTRGGHIHAGITGGALLFLYLLQEDRHDLLHLMVNQPGYPGWAEMLRRGATTLWETWEEPTGSLSRLHSSFLYVGAWPIAGVLGISPAVPGFTRVRICPGPVGDPELNWAAGHFDSARGRIRVAWRSQPAEFSLDVEIPPGMTAEIGLPADGASEMTEGGRPLREVAGVGGLRRPGSRRWVEVASGGYSFRVRFSEVAPASASGS